MSLESFFRTVRTFKPPSRNIEDSNQIRRFQLTRLLAFQHVLQDGGIILIADEDGIYE
jgi:hypothetical protein